MKNVYTTKEVGEFCGVDLTTVINWIKQDKLNAYKTAGGHRRIKKKDLIEFMKKYSMPIPAELLKSDIIKVLYITRDREIVQKIDSILENLPETYETKSVENTFEAGFELSDLNPGAVFIDTSLTKDRSKRIIEFVKGKSIKRLLICRNEKQLEELGELDGQYIIKTAEIEEIKKAVKKFFRQS